MTKLNHDTVLFVSYDGMTDPLGQSQVIPYLSGLSKAGYAIHLLSCEKPENFKKNRSYIDSLLKQVNIIWHPISYTKKPPVVSTFIDIYRMKKMAKKIHKEFSLDAIHCRSYIAALVGVKMKKSFGIKFLFDIRGFWADERVDGGIWDTSKFLYNQIYKYFKRKEKIFFNAADAVVTLTNSSKKHIVNEFHINAPVTVIPCAADLNLFAEVERKTSESFKKKVGLDKSYILLYLGSLGTWYLLKEMLDFFVELKKKKTTAKFLFVTADAPEVILKEGSKLGLQASDFHIVSAPRLEVPKWISIANASVFFIKDCFSKMASSPTKHGEILAGGIPVVCNKIGDLEEIIAYKNSGVLVEGLTEKSYQKAILELEQEFVKEDALKTAVEFYSLEVGVQKYIQIYCTFN